MSGATEPRAEPGDCDRMREELLNVLETARGRLAIAIAGESKSTPAIRRKQYLETADYMLRYIRTLRDDEGRIRVAGDHWIPALESLQSIPEGMGAQFLCDRLRIIVAGLNGEKL